MNYITVPELALLAPEAAELAAVAGREINYINRASTLLDGYLNRSRYGLEVRAVMSVQVPLSLSFSGVLPASPFVAWIGTEASLIYAKTGEQLQPIPYDFFAVDRRAGVISSATARLVPRFPQDRSLVRSPYLDNMVQYHGSLSSLVEQNESPFTATLSFRTGMYLIRPVVLSSSGAIGLGEITLDSVDYLNVGDEFYFDQDVVSEQDTDRRFITSIDTENKVVGFEPALAYPLPTTAKFRRIDRSVRVATASLIGILATYPPDTKVFSEGIGRSALTNTWQRSDGGDVMHNVSHLMRL